MPRYIRRKTSLPLVFLTYFGIALWICQDAFFGGRTLWPSRGDLYVDWYGPFHFFVHWVRQGILPLWDPLALCGHPSGLQGISAFDLYHLLSLFLGINQGYNVVSLSAAWLKGIFFYLLLTTNGFSPFPAFSGGVLWMLLPAGESDNGLFFLPLSFLLAGRYIERKTRLRFTLFVFATALQALNTNTHTLLYCSAWVALYMLIREFSLHSKSLRGLWMVCLPFLVAGGLVMFHFARMFELVALSSRPSVGNISVLLPLHYPLILFPKLLESFSRPELGFVLTRSLQRVFTSIPFLGKVQDFLAPPYVGIFPPLALASWFFLRKTELARRFLVRFSIVSMVALFFYLSLHPLLYLLLIQYLPLLKGMHHIGRIFEIYFFCLSVLTAWGIEALLAPLEEKKDALRKTERLFAGVGVFLITALFLGRWAIFHFREPLAQKIAGSLDPLQGPTFQEQRIEEFFHFFQSITSFTSPHLLLPFFLIAVLFFVLHLYSRNRVPAILFKGFIPLFMAIDLGLWGKVTLPSSAPEELLRYHEVAEAIKQDSSIYRVMLLDDGSVDPATQFLRPESNMLFGIATPDGYEQLYLRRYVRFYDLLTQYTTPGIEEWNGMLQTFNEFDEDLADLINVKYLVTSLTNPKLDKKGYEKTAEVPPYKIYRNVDALPRIFVVRQVSWAPNEEEAFNYLKEFPQSLRDTVVLEGVRPAPLKGNKEGDGNLNLTDKAKIKTYQPNLVEVDVELTSEGYVVFTDTTYPGWRAYVDDQEVPIILANYAFRAVRLGPGRQRLRWVYAPSSARIGGFVSLASFLAFLGFLKRWRLPVQKT